ncbi:T9SS type A sorting domain-containing protein [Flavobacterium sp. PLA-1-15]|uniref:T9SS type A sorting domain-containing protein n=1 Tax=Flavobacterium sp. PLA-1-15 TaxID=3380533 RepID=UPI003B8137AE
MKKLYTLLFVAFASIASFAQTTTEDFVNSTATASYGDGTFVGNGGITYSFVHSRNAGTGSDDYTINAEGLMLRRPSDSYLEATYPNGLSSFSFQFRKAFTGGAIRQLEVLVNGEVVSTTQEFGEGAGADATVYTHSLTINQAGPVTVRIKCVGDATITANRQTTLDNIVWAPQNLSVKQNSIAGLQVYPNPVTNGTLYINTTANASKEVVIYDVLGKQVVKTTTENAVNVSKLNAGVYIVKVTEEGNTATRKLVIK